MRIQLNQEIDYMQLIHETYCEPDYTLKVRRSYSVKNAGLGIETYEVIIKNNENGKRISKEYSGASYGSVITYVCPDCGCEIYGQWKEEFFLLGDFTDFPEVQTIYEGRTGKEMKEMQGLCSCPVCKGALSKEKGYYVSEDSVLHPNIDSYFETMKMEREASESNTFDEEVQEKIALWSGASVSLPSNIALEEIKNDSAKLKEYLNHLIKLEMNAYSLSKRLLALYIQKLKMQRLINCSENALKYQRKQKKQECEYRIQECNKKIKLYEAGNIDVPYPAKPLEPTYGIPGLLNKKKVLAENENLKLKYQDAVKRYDEKVAEYEAEKQRLISAVEEEIANYKAEIEHIQHVDSSSDSAKNNSIIEGKSIIDNEILEVEKILKEICECRNRMYKVDVVFAKYRDVVALTTFYEYLMSGRCTTLEGADGAYNLYEEQVRADMIIGQLSQVISKLDDIKDSQFMIYSELKSINRNLDNLNNTMNKALTSVQNMEHGIKHISENTDVIAHNTAVTAYYSKINAELTDSLGYMVAFK